MDLGGLLVDRANWSVDFGLLIVRFFIGTCFVVHGLSKLGLVGMGNMEGFVQWLRELDVPMPAVQARIAMLSEIVGGTLVVAGLFTRPACFLLIGTMVIAWRVGYQKAGYLITNEPPGAEYVINLAMICGVVALLGPGALSLDAALF